MSATCSSTLNRTRSDWAIGTSGRDSGKGTWYLYASVDGKRPNAFSG